MQENAQIAPGRGGGRRKNKIRIEKCIEKTKERGKKTLKTKQKTHLKSSQALFVFVASFVPNPPSCCIVILFETKVANTLEQGLQCFSKSFSCSKLKVPTLIKENKN